MKKNILKTMAVATATAILIGLAGCSLPTTQSSSQVEDTAQQHVLKLGDLTNGEKPSAQTPIVIPSDSEAESSSSQASSSSQTASSQAVSSSTATKSTATVSSSSQVVSSSSVPEASSSQAPVESSSAPVEESSSSEQTASSEISTYNEENTTIYQTSYSSPDEVKAVWISYLEFDGLAKNKSREQFTSNMDAVFKNAVNYGLNTVMLQVRPFGDSMYPSDIFPWSYILTGTEGVGPGYDPFGVMVSLANKYGLRVEAWINPYRVRAVGSTRSLSNANPALRAINAGEDTAIAFNGGIFYNPDSQKARDLITAGVVEILENYNIVGIHFDDYFYPTTDLSFDSRYYNAYTSSGGRLSQADWRRENVNKLIKQVYSAVKNTNPAAIFGISPQARMDNNYHGQFADIEKWVTGSGYIDYICPQIYFGFNNSTVPYEENLAMWSNMVKGTNVDLYIGLAVYKCGVTDSWAGSGTNEWVNSTTMLKRMVESARSKTGYSGFALYRYDSIFSPASSVSSHIQKERDNLYNIL